MAVNLPGGDTGGQGPSVFINGHFLLQQLNDKAAKLLELFDLLPGTELMNGLDVLQGVVNTAVHKITSGRVSSVKFVPVEAEAISSKSNHDGMEPTVCIKTEPPDIDEQPTMYDTEVLSFPDGSSAYISGAHIASSRLSNTNNKTKGKKKSKEQKSPGSKTIKKNNNKSTQVKTSVTKQSSGDRKKDSVSFNPVIPSKPPAQSAVVKKPLRFLKVALNGSTLQLTKKTKKKTKVKDKTKNVEKDIKKNTDKTSQLKAKKKSVGKVTAKSGDVEKVDPYGSDTDDNTSFTNDTVEESTAARAVGDGAILEETSGDERKELMMKMIPPEMRLQNTRKRKQKDPETARFKCDKCEYVTNKKLHMDAHTTTHTGESKFTCQKCGKCLTAASSLKRHMMAHKGIKPYECPVCSKAFVDMAGLRSHTVVHTGERLFPCDECPKMYTNAGNLRRHKRFHTGETPYACQKCDARYRDLSSLKLHELKHTGEKPYLCEICNKQFKTSSDFRRHERTHTGERNYKCKLCGKMFIQGWHLKQHERMHGGAKPWGPCGECGKRFRSKAALQHHERSHAGIKPYSCPRCNKSFSTRRYLICHQVLHTLAKPFRCHKCSREFNQLSNLRRHERIHSEVTRYTCQFCDKAFKYINSWRYHEGIHKGELLKCEKCGAARRSRAGILRHKCTGVDGDKNTVKITSIFQKRKPKVISNDVDRRTTRSRTSAKKRKLTSNESTTSNLTSISDLPRVILSIPKITTNGGEAVCIQEDTEKENISVKKSNVAIIPADIVQSKPEDNDIGSNTNDILSGEKDGVGDAGKGDLITKPSLTATDDVSGDLNTASDKDNIRLNLTDESAPDIVYEDMNVGIFIQQSDQPRKSCATDECQKEESKSEVHDQVQVADTMCLELDKEDDMLPVITDVFTCAPVSDTT